MESVLTVTVKLIGLSCENAEAKQEKMKIDKKIAFFIIFIFVSETRNRECYS